MHTHIHIFTYTHIYTSICIHTYVYTYSCLCIRGLGSTRRYHGESGMSLIKELQNCNTYIRLCNPRFPRPARELQICHCNEWWTLQQKEKTKRKPSGPATLGRTALVQWCGVLISMRCLSSGSVLRRTTP